MSAIWARCKELLRTRVNDHTVNTWFEPIICEEISDNRLVLSVPNSFFVAWIKERYSKVLSECLAEAAGKEYEFDFQSRDEVLDNAIVVPDEFADSIKCEDISVTAELALQRNLNPRYSFESFVVGGCNQFAHAAAMSVSENLGKSYNPLFIYGGVGLGKTHLMSAIGYAVLKKDKSKKISFSTSEEFTNELINAIRFDRMLDFRGKYRNVDLLLIDDIQFIAGKERTQEEFFHTFNSIYEAGKQIVITSDRFPREIPELEHRLKSRFSWGLVADMGVPDLETKVAILRRKASEDKMEIPDEVSYFLAEQVESNVRELVGYLVRVVAMSTLQGLPLTKSLAQTALKEILHRPRKNISVDDIISVVSKAYNVKPADIKSKKRHKLYAQPRQVGMYLARELTELSYPEIGASFGGKDHSTVIHATRKIEKKMEQDSSLKNFIDGLKKDIRL
ncbi:chromosomal replication initiator protein DnaA [Desulfomonile tiedjei]|uniref:Chromosomal replication initiator protein DnaA n=1 Tax=Desulfomonile tiedjei (strain ATCC 49306 / DSM 6799 / DCB-1) TaxID=706587 RepID=I4BZL2_DESTA|nr:chromosomal replication initiator protein DnaA [Desulfomonile tiedjei]AFM22753.1 chromosomal replication initiator protein DnaA [Desulfomonile tiedjei DSM 6799]